MRARIESIALPLVVGVLVVAVWSASVRWTGTKVFPSPLQVVRGMGELSRRGVLLPYLRDSLVRVAIGYGAAVALGLGATTFALLAHRADDDLSGDLAQFPGNRTAIDHDRSRLKTWAGFTDGFGAAALIAAGLGTYFLLAGPSGEAAAPPSRSAQLSLLPSGAALSLSGSF